MKLNLTYHIYVFIICYFNINYYLRHSLYAN